MSDDLLLERVERASRAAFVADVGVILTACGPGWVESQLPLTGRHLQHSGVVHAGVIATIADHTAGAAVMTVVDPSANVLSVEFKLNLLRGARAEGAQPRLECRGQVLKRGARISVVEAEVFGYRGTERELCAKLIATMMATPPTGD